MRVMSCLVNGIFKQRMDGDYVFRMWVYSSRLENGIEYSVLKLYDLQFKKIFKYWVRVFEIEMFSDYYFGLYLKELVVVFLIKGYIVKLFQKILGVNWGNF